MYATEMPTDEQAHALLTDLGLTDLEAKVYTFLLGNPPVTAYRVARHLGTPTANTYKAIESLARRGAVLIEEGENRLCRAVPAAEFLGHLERSFARLTRDTAEVLADLDRPSHDERVYKLESVPLVMERCRQMLEERLERVAMVDAFPAALDAIRPSLERAVVRGADVLVQAYRPVELEGVELAIPARGPDSERQWGAQQLNVVIDGREALIVLMNNELTTVLQGIWTNSLYLACLLQAGMMAEHTLHGLVAAQRERDGPAQMRTILQRHRFFLTADIPGQKELLARFSRTSDAGA
jgi:HTH-type transcriptional regulator, sugar sensing transcriptional regulator